LPSRFAKRVAQNQVFAKNFWKKTEKFRNLSFELRAHS